MPRKYQPGSLTGSTVLVVDDSPDILESTRRLLEAEGHRVLTALDGPAALRILEREHVALLLLDYYLPGMTGGEVVRQVRKVDLVVQIILITGYAGKKPPRVVMRELDIQGYHDKSEGAERLLLWVDAALNTYRHALATERHRAGLRFMLDAAPQMYQAQSFEQLLERLLLQVSELQGVDSAFVAVLPLEVSDASTPETAGFVAVNWAEFQEAPLEVRFGTGRYRQGMTLDVLPEPERSSIMDALRRGCIVADKDRSVVPLHLGKRPIGIIYVDRGVADTWERELLEVFANQAAAAVHNALLSRVATTDSLTGVFLRRFAKRRLHECLESGQRRGEPVSLLMIDLDGFKAINDRHGHYLGDQALAAVAMLLQSCVRDPDVIGRYGGDEFVVVLPDTTLAGARIVASRILRQTEKITVPGDGDPISLRLSLGIGTFCSLPEDRTRAMRTRDFALAAKQLLISADQALYSGKHSGAAAEAPPLYWSSILASDPDPAPASATDAGPNPSEAAMADPFQSPLSGTAPGPAGPFTHHPLHLLVVDDEETVRRSLSRYLRRCGHYVDEATDGRQALEMVERAEAAGYDVILSDVKMPVMRGDQLLRELQKRGDDLHSRVIFLTGHEPSGEAARTIAEVGSLVVLKPYELREVGRLVEQRASRPTGPDAA